MAATTFSNVSGVEFTNEQSCYIIYYNRICPEHYFGKRHILLWPSECKLFELTFGLFLMILFLSAYQLTMSANRSQYYSHWWVVVTRRLPGTFLRNTPVQCLDSLSLFSSHLLQRRLLGSFYGAFFVVRRAVSYLHAGRHEVLMLACEVFLWS